MRIDCWRGFISSESDKRRSQRSARSRDGVRGEGEETSGGEAFIRTLAVATFSHNNSLRLPSAFLMCS